ncbi:OapA family protein [Chiayiivirga flava]|uniref:Murein DD-endopeptidase MepM/ murein hydrolase activator NlpD n=1 Tax=Chiayiivirga flava TaxID=659595 RepID=A0A7W8G079_9GAMM|nr:peptidoglycan DD-metalloendopeptidase family protein [Chiayiivirga flava]MBB5207443.1 murein DD-endopeptidase MepM/ murein hydrolase activator NlpD [Chiayiivirga flava]
MPPEQASVGTVARPVLIRREHWVLASLVATTLTLVAAIVPGFANATLKPYEAEVLTQPLPLPLPEPVAPVEAAAGLIDDAIAAENVAADAPAWRTVTVQPGQTMGDIFASLSLPGATLHRLLDRPGAGEALTKIRPGNTFDFDIAADGTLRGLRFDRGESARVTLTLVGDEIVESVLQRDVQSRIQMTGGEIRGSLYADGAKAGLGNGTIVAMATVFGYDIDFAQDLRVGDSFSVVYEDIYRDGERLRSGDILAATFVNQGKRYTAFRYVFEDGRVEYFDADGRPLKKSFLRTPLEFTRISSLFSTGRKHPILGKVRRHAGVDYAAPSGTPIRAAGDGRVTFAGWKNGYGRTVIVDHGRGYTTLYGHLSKFGKYKTGTRVSQNATIGYVGMSGLATGPHLHYEFRVNGAHRDPLKVTLPKPEPLPRSELARFQMQTQPLLAKLDLLDGKRRYAAR